MYGMYVCVYSFRLKKIYILTFICIYLFWYTVYLFIYLVVDWKEDF